MITPDLGAHLLGMPGKREEEQAHALLPQTKRSSIKPIFHGLQSYTETTLVNSWPAAGVGSSVLS